MIKKKLETTRQIPTTKDFTQLRNVDLIYGYLQSISKWDGKTSYRYVNKSEFVRSEVKRLLGVGSVNTVSNRLNALIKNGFVKEEDGKYILQVDTPYVLVDFKVLKFLLDTSNINVINVYAFLKWKFYYNSDRDFYFTNKQIVEDVLGYTYNTRENEKVGNILTSLENNNLIEFEVVHIGGYKSKKYLRNVSDALEPEVKPVVEEVAPEPVEAPVREKFVF